MKTYGEKMYQKRIKVSKKLYPNRHPGSLLNSEIAKVNKVIYKKR